MIPGYFVDMFGSSHTSQDHLATEVSLARRALLSLRHSGLRQVATAPSPLHFAAHSEGRRFQPPSGGTKPTLTGRVRPREGG